MTKLLISCLLLADLFVMQACRSTEPIVLPVLSADQAVIRLNRSARFAHNVVVQVTDIHDSRCPQDVVCVLAGIATVKLIITKGNDVQSAHLQLGFPTLTQRVDSTGFIFAGESYKVVLRNVIPYPNTSKKLMPKQAIVQVTKI